MRSSSLGLWLRLALAWAALGCDALGCDPLGGDPEGANRLGSGLGADDTLALPSDETSQRLQAQVARSPRSEEAHLQLAQHYVRLRRWQLALAQTQAVLALSPEHPQATRLATYIPELEAAPDEPARAKLMIQLASETLSDVSAELAETDMSEADAQQAAKRRALREQYAITDALLDAQKAATPEARTQLALRLEAADTWKEKYAVATQALAESKRNPDAMTHLLDLLIESERYADAAEAVATFRKRLPEQVALRIYETHIDAMREAERVEVQQRLKTELAFERLTLSSLIAHHRMQAE